MALETLWSESFPTRTRPQTYSSQEIAADGYLPLTDTSDFLVDSLHGLGASQLYALTANNAEALRQAQEEWTNLERLANQLKSQDRFSTAYKDPQALPPHEIFEERKEATLYSYKYEPSRPMLQSKFTLPTGTTDQEKFDLREPPNPFAQRIPNDKQYRSMMSTAKNEGREKNPDNQAPYEENFAFQARPRGTWIARMAPTEAVQPPRTRAREAQLNGITADRQTRFNGEKVPPTRGVASADELPSQGPTPIGSPASRKRRIETVDVALPRKKHPNQHTKRREREEAERLAALNQQGAVVTSQTDSVASPIPTPKKKHPNQYTKRREREEAERLLREQEEESLREVTSYFESLGDRPSVLPPRRAPSSYIVPTYVPEKKKHPNQYTKRREQEQAEKIAELESWLETCNERDLRERAQRNDDKDVETTDVAPRHETPASPRLQPQNHPSRNIDFSNMTTAELRTFTFKDWELTSLLEERYLWLNDDPALAKQWKIKIENSAYAMRTYAMLKKWKEWASEGRDKRPRDKDKNKPRGKTESSARADGEEADVESMADDPVDNSVDVNNDSHGRTNSRIVTLKRPVRTRSSRLPFEAGESPKAMPSSPLVNGVNARDLDGFNKMSDQAKVRSFTNTLQTIGEVDNATKVGRWQADTVTNSAADAERNEEAAKMITPLPTPARLVTHGTEDDMYPSTQSTLQPETDDVHIRQQDTTISANDKMDVDSEDPLALPTHASPDTYTAQEPDDPSWPNATGYLPSGWTPSEAADTIMVNEPSVTVHNRTKQKPEEDRHTSNMARTRSQRSTRSNNITVSPNKRSSQQQQQSVPSPSRPRVTRGSSSYGTNINAAVTANRPRHEQTPVTNAPSTSTESTSPIVTNGIAGTSTSTRRAGLRPNPVKRTLTGESLKAGSGSGGVREVDGVPVRRSLRGSGVV